MKALRSASRLSIVILAWQGPSLRAVRENGQNSVADLGIANESSKFDSHEIRVGLDRRAQPSCPPNGGANGVNSATAHETRSSSAAPIHLRLLRQSGPGPAVRPYRF